MVYVTVKLPPFYHQMTIDEFLFGAEEEQKAVCANTTNTRTYEMDYLNGQLLRRVHVYRSGWINKLRAFNESVAELRAKPRKNLYREFYIPKKSGGLRKIDAPNDELMAALRRLKAIFENDFGVLYHTSAFAYVKKRSTLDAVKRHQQNESKWFGKYDLSNFFGSTTLDFVMHMFSMIYPFSEIVKIPEGKENLRAALELAFLDGGLPQGTPISPLITNVMMIPIDYKLANEFRNHKSQRFVYTRYADDFLVSSRYDFDFREIENTIVNTLQSFDAPFSIKREKTRYGSSAGQNFNLGLMLNKDNQITVGHKKKRRFQAMLASYVMDKKNGKEWDKSDIQVLDGYRSYYKMIEGETIDKIVEHIGTKFGVDIPAMIKQDLSV